MKRLYIAIVLVAIIVMPLCEITAITLPKREKTEWCKFSAQELQGEIKIPVVFVNFTTNSTYNESTSQWEGSDATSVTSDNQSKWMEQLNNSCSRNFLNLNGSVQDYFKVQSYGKLTISFEKAGVINAGSADELDKYADQAIMIKNKLSTLSSVNWNKFDSNKDGEVDCILLVYAGHACYDYTSSYMTNYNIYPNRNWISNLTGSKLQLGSMKADSYVMTNDLRNESNDIDGLATVIHELGHGIFDLNDYYNNSTSYVGQYDAMDFGFRQMSNYSTYMPQGEHPCCYTAFNRMYLGWLTPIELTKACTVELRPLDEYADACIIADPNDQNHFFMLEYRKKNNNSWDAHLPSEGLILTEINYNTDKFNYHGVNSNSPKNITLIDANTNSATAISSSSYYNYNQSYAAYGKNGKTSIPATVNQLFATKTVTNIQIKNNGTLTFNFMGGGETINAIDFATINTENNNDIKKLVVNNTICIIKNKRIYNLQGKIIE